MEKKIILIIPYFGKFKPEFYFWLKSVEHNPTVDFLLVTNQDINIKVPCNVLIIKTTFCSFVNKVQQYYDFPIKLTNPYKICDFRPAFGEIFHSNIQTYDFWGHCDTDMILGNIRHFITDELLSKYDRILVHGHFTLYRNNIITNETYKKALPSYKEVFSSDENYAFDEAGRGNGTTLYWYRNLRDKVYNENFYDDIFTLKDNFIPVNHQKENGKHYIYNFENGRLFRIYELSGKIKKEETMYVHFQKRKLLVPAIAYDQFTIVPNKIIPYIDNPTLKFIRRKGRNRIINKHFFNIKAKSFIKKCKKHLFLFKN